MGFFENLKKKNEAKKLGLTVEQYDAYPTFQAIGITLEEYKRYLSSFAGRYNPDQYAKYLLLEKKGYTRQQCMRYLDNLSSLIKPEDYHAFLRAESVGLSEMESVTYASTVRTQMSAEDYVGFLQAQRSGITLENYLEYLNSFEKKMTIDEYLELLKAPSQEVAEEVPVVAEREPEEEKIAMEKPVEKKLVETKPEEKEADKLTTDTSLKACRPGEEPEKIKKRLNTLFAKLDAAYPDKNIVGLNKDHKKWGETVTELYRLLNYPDNKTFLEAYGYTISGSGRPSSDPMAVVNELKRRYANGPTCTKMADLFAENPDLAPKCKNLQNQADEFFGMTLAKYFIQEGILIGKTNDQVNDTFKALKARYASEPFVGTVNELRDVNTDIDWGVIQKYYKQSGTKDTFKVFLINEGILGVKSSSVPDHLTSSGIPATKETPKERLDRILSVLKERYVDSTKKAYSLSDLARQNPDISLDSLKKVIRSELNKDTKAYLLEQGILSEEEWVTEARIREQRIAEQKAAQKEAFKNDLPIEEQIKRYSDLYKEQTTDNPFFKVPIPKKGPETKESYSTYRVGETEETTTDGFVIRRGVSNGEPYVELHKYLGHEEIVKVPDGVTDIWDLDCFTNPELKKVIIPDSVQSVNWRSFSPGVRKNLPDENGLSIVGRFLIEYCGSADEVRIPEGVQEITYTAFAGNKSINRVYMPESIKWIGNSAFSGCENLATVVFDEKTKELDRVEYSAFAGCRQLEFVHLPVLRNVDEYAFSNVPGISSKNGFQVLGNALLGYSGSKKQVTIPEGVSVIGANAFRNSPVESVKLTTAVKTIGSGAFSSCRHLLSVNLEHVENIEDRAFDYCQSLTEVDLTSAVSIGDGAFYNCRQLVEVAVSECMKELGTDTFSGCSMLSSINLKGSSNNRLPDSLGALPDNVFLGCEALQAIEIPGNVKKIGYRAFASCVNLQEAVLCEGVEEIGMESFIGTKALKRFVLPKSVKTIGRDAFYRCSCSKDITLNEELFINKAYYGITDENDCIVENGILKQYVQLDEKVARISDGVIVIDEDSLRYAVSRSDKLKEIILPDSVRVIRDTCFDRASRLKMNIPKGYLLQHSKLPVEALDGLLGTIWKHTASVLDWVSVYLYQNNKRLDEHCRKAFSLAPDAFVAASLVVLSNRCTTKEIERIADVIFDLGEKTSQEFIDRFYQFAKDHKADKAIIALKSLASASASGASGDGKTSDNEAEAFCNQHFNEYDIQRMMEKAKIKEKDLLNNGVKYKEDQKEVPPFVLKCAIIPYVGQYTERPRNIGSYRSDYSRFSFLENADKIATHFDKASFVAYLEQFSKLADGYSAPQIWIPVCRYGSGDQIKRLISSFSGWENWYVSAANGRSAIITCRGAIMLSDTREAMMYAEKCGCLHYYASIRGTTESVIRDTKLVDFGFDEDGKKRYDLGNAVLEAYVGNDLSIVLYDTSARKVVKSLPKRGADPQKYEACSADYSEMKKNIKKVVKQRNDLLFGYFRTGAGFEASSWVTAYTENPVLNRVARLLVWAQGEKTFTMSDSGVIDSLGNAVNIDLATRIALAHPLEMDDTDISRWQKYFTSNGLKQPFEQIWEPKYTQEIQKDRYKGCMIPYYRFLHQEKHGIRVYDSDYHNEITISLDGCDSDIQRIDWARHSIDMKDKFEIQSITVKKMTRRANHLIYYFDKCTIYERIEQDDDSTAESLQGYTVAQIDAFLKYAIEKGSTKCTAAFLTYKNEHFSDFAAMDEFVLDL